MKFIKYIPDYIFSEQNKIFKIKLMERMKYI